MIVTIDGPAGAGKSSAARELARRIGFLFLDTGAMYRSVAYSGLQQHVDWNNSQLLAQIAESMLIKLVGDRLVIDGQDVSDVIRSVEVTTVTRYAADNPQVREFLAEKQRQLAQGENIVTEGRDQGSLVFPSAECKIFLTASAEERAGRRHRDLLAAGNDISLQEVLEQQNRRDQEDQDRPYGALIEAPDSARVVTDDMNPEQVVDRLEEIVREKMSPQA